MGYLQAALYDRESRMGRPPGVKTSLECNRYILVEGKRAHKGSSGKRLDYIVVYRRIICRMDSVVLIRVPMKPASPQHHQ